MNPNTKFKFWLITVICILLGIASLQPIFICAFGVFRNCCPPILLALAVVGFSLSFSALRICKRTYSGKKVLALPIFGAALCLTGILLEIGICVVVPFFMYQRHI